MNPATSPHLLTWIQHLLCTLILVTFANAGVAADVDTADPRNQLNRISDTLYQFTDDDAAGAVLLTTAGAVVVDPMNTETALWLKRELDTRFGQAVSYVIYSSHLDDRIGGTDVFAADGARVVAHENALAHLPESETHTP
ncbi:MAG: hypothetical protein KTR32_43280, partial [Granulosicoccus sp.]|nr:hypothetical protein [Granulosicoccus sp.]